ncbi:MAG: zinc ribbon domain-containing protein [Proteobacteria bacterium]|nr:zinc ribbon domain-containing protein [Pseudomonadota bacterium]
MPFYEYECQSCKFYTELMQKISDPPLVKCPSCGKRTMQKLISAPVFRLKGSGWYETDFKSDKEDKRNLAAEREEATSRVPPGLPAAEESKPETKAPAAEAAKPAEPKVPSVSTAAAASKPRAAALRKGVAPRKGAAPAKASSRPATSRAKAKPAARAKAAKRGSRR